MSLPTRLRDGRLLVPVALLILTTIYFIEAVQMGPPIRDGNMTVSFFPLAIAFIMFLAIAGVLWRIFQTPSDTDQSAESHEDKRRLGPLWVALLTGLYIFAFSYIGYFVATAIYVFALTMLFGEGAKGLPVKLVATLIITVCGYLLFEVAFQVRLPTLWS
ncbi:tripartite tricarboxylate transporter TctB family protein [Modicisalibacter luteus]|uniref:Tripartite tricarboxylate transporter TctB family protein n=1 Tax=Modicisalibacter luteus TaxID=453962 RepID=A0ABV7LY11_9GAMM|nr:tripartite tricarboxylate transporter TctB family protein [Halomonas lutea]GHB04807.1 hypothetical protein GCM10007159_28310 [Halomonas lutea]